MMGYDLLDDSFYTVYEDVDTTPVKIQLPLDDEPVELDWAEGVFENGTPLVKDNTLKPDDSQRGRGNGSIEDEWFNYPTLQQQETEEIENPETVDWTTLTPPEQSNEPGAEPTPEKPNDRIYNPNPTPTQTNPTQAPVDNARRAGKYKIKPTLGGNQRRAMDFFVSKNLPVHVAAGIVGNLMLESGDTSLNTTTNLGDRGSAYGMAQWRLDRRQQLKRFAANRGKPMSDFETQLEFVWYELNNGYSSVLQKLLRCKTPKEATTIFMNSYEKPSSDPNVNGIAKRVKYAESLVV